MRRFAATILLLLLPALACAQTPVRIGNFVDFSGRTAAAGQDYGRGKIDALAWINARGGIAGRPLEALTVDFAYIAPRALEAFQTWQSEGGVAAILGWGHADTEALRRDVEEAQIPYFTADYSADLTVPTPSAPGVARAAPYHFFAAPSYSDMARGLVRWAAKDWQRRRPDAPPRLLQIGDGGDFSAALRHAAKTYAEELGFTLLADILRSPGAAIADLCSAVREARADYVMLGLTAVDHVALAQACPDALGGAQLMTHVWGFDRHALDIGGTVLDGIVWTPGAAIWGEDVRGMERIRAIAAAGRANNGEDGPPADDAATVYSSHYIRGVCTVFYLKEAIELALADGAADGPAIKRAMYVRDNWVPEGLSGACPPASWRADDHRSVMDIRIYRAHLGGEVPAMERLDVIQVPRRPEWRGW